MIFDCVLTCASGRYLSYILPLAFLLSFCIALLARDQLKRLAGYWSMNVVVLLSTPYLHSIMDCEMLWVVKSYLTYLLLAIPLLVAAPFVYKVYLFRFYRIERFTEMEGYLRKVSASEKSKIYVIEKAVPKAFTLGRDVFLTAGILELMSEEKLKAVIAHEAFHVKQNRFPMIYAFRLLTFIPFRFERLADSYAEKIAGREVLIEAKNRISELYC
jgi:heat shock protein HtpX